MNNSTYPPTLEPILTADSPELIPLMLKSQRHFEKFVTEECPEDDEEEDSEIPEGVKS